MCGWTHARGTLYESHYRNLILVFWPCWLCALVVLAAVSLAHGLSGCSLFWPLQSWPWPGLALVAALG